MEKLNVIILAGGVSSRFFPLKEKNAFKFLGQNSLEFHISQLKGIETDIFVVLPEDTTISEESGWTKILQEGSGMAGAVKSALKEIKSDGEVLILNANDFYDNSLVESFITTREKLKEDGNALLTGYKTAKYFPGGYLSVEGDYVTSIVEKPGEGNEPSDLVDIVFDYFPSAKTLSRYLEKANSDKDDLFEVALDNMMKDGVKFRILQYSGDWKTIKYPWQVLDVTEFFLNQIPSQQISDKASVSHKATIKGNVIIEDDVKIFEGAVVNGPAYIGKGTVIANNALVRESIIGEGCVVGFDTEIARSYLGNNVWLHKNYVGDSVLENNVSFGSNSVTGNLRLDEQEISMTVKGERIKTGRNKLGTIIGSNVRVGVNANIMPGVSIGPGSFVGPNINLDKDLAAGKFITVKQSVQIKDNTFDISKTSREEIKKKLG
jgi:NDP-sugar pyrophosphorylase family protein